MQFGLLVSTLWEALQSRPLRPQERTSSPVPGYLTKSHGVSTFCHNLIWGESRSSPYAALSSWDETVILRANHLPTS